MLTGSRRVSLWKTAAGTSGLFAAADSSASSGRPCRRRLKNQSPTRAGRCQRRFRGLGMMEARRLVPLRALRWGRTQRVPCQGGGERGLMKGSWEYE